MQRTEDCAIVQRGTGYSAASRYPVPEIRGRRSKGFFPALGLTFLAWVIGWPFLTLGFMNRSDSPDVAWNHGLYERKNVALQRAASTGRPRLLVEGGSGALFGVDADLIGRRLNIEAINDGTHAALDTYILRRAESVLRPGDSVLLTPEYELWWRTDLTDVEWNYAVTYDKRFVWARGTVEALRSLYSLPGTDYWDWLIAWGKWLQGREAVDANYNLAEVDAAGDLRVVLPRKPFPIPTGCHLPDASDPGCAVAAYRAFGQWARANHVRVFYAWPNVCRPEPLSPLEERATPADVRKLFDELGFILLDDPADTWFPSAWFIDTPYHLDAGGRRVRTEALIRRLQPYYGQSPAPAGPAGIYLVGRTTRWLRDANAFADRPGVQAKYLVAERVGSADAVTPSDVEALARRGVPIYCDDPAVEAMLPSNQWDAREIAREGGSIAAWLKRYDRHVFVLARSGPVRPDAPPLGDDLPVDARAALDGAKPAVAVVGTGPWQAVHKTLVREGGVYVNTRLASLAGRAVPSLGITAGARAGRSSIRANGRMFATAENGEICVAVFEPEQGILVDAATFAGGGTKVLASMRQLSPRPATPAADAK